MSKLTFGTTEYEAIVERAQKLSHDELVELAQEVGIEPEGTMLDEHIAAALDESNSKESVLAYLEAHGV